MPVPALAEWKTYLDDGSPVLLNEQLREADRQTGSRMPSLLLMEQAAMQAARYLEHCPAPYLILVGPGNNGGDGLALARMLLSRELDVDLWWVDEQWKGDAATNHQLLQALLPSQPPRIFGPTSPPPWTRYRCLVDCLFGSGLNRPVDGCYREVIERANSLSALRIAVDIPSGLQGDSPSLPPCSFVADATIVLCAPRLAHLLLPAAQQCGSLHIAPIGISQSTLTQAADQPPSWQLVGRRQLKLPARSSDSYKGSYGHVLLVGGCQQSSGAVRMAARSALRSGAGLVSIAADPPILPTLATDLPDVQLAELPEEETPRFLWPHFHRYAALVIGCGWGRSLHRHWLLEQLLRRFHGPVVVDADGLFSLSYSPQLLTLLADRAVLTPHWGEFAKLLQNDQPCPPPLSHIGRDRTFLAPSYAQQHRLTLVLKGSDTLVCSAQPDGPHTGIIRRGNDALARGGSGDVLAGLIGGLLAQGLSPVDAAQTGAWVLGRAGEIAASRRNRRCLLSSQLPRHFSTVFDEMEQPPTEKK